MWKKWLLLFGSFACVAFGVPFWVPGLGMVASAVGYALFWRVAAGRFWLAVAWFGAVQGVQLSWMTSMEYMGVGILFVYGCLALGIGLQFGGLTWFLGRGRPIPLRRCLAAASMWVLLEWSRLWVLTGFPWNPVGLALADSSYAIQMASLCGIYGLSFWVIWVNLCAFNGWRWMWAACALFPYGFGWVQQSIVERVVSPQPAIAVALVQTALLPEQKEQTRGRREAFIPPLAQWDRVLALLKGPLDLIVFPEAAFPHGAYRPIATGSQVSNAYLAQQLAEEMQAQVVIGLDDEEVRGHCNAAFCFSPGAAMPERYEKRVLMPIVEYLPLSNWQFLMEFIANNYGIESSFFPGQEAKVFARLGVSICAEEIYSDLMRQVRLKGAEVFVNLSNDVWFPRSRLPYHHFQHARVRAAENGVYLLRSSNTGVTGIIDCFGRALATLPLSETRPDVLLATVAPRSFSTLYTIWGDWAMVLLSLCLFAQGWRKKLP